jgi:hypothetical protein
MGLIGGGIIVVSNTFHHGKMRKAGLFLLSLSLSQHLGYNTFTFSTPCLQHLNRILNKHESCLSRTWK